MHLILMRRGHRLTGGRICQARRVPFLPSFSQVPLLMGSRMGLAYRKRKSYILRHWAVKWFIERVENGNGMHLAKFVLGNPAEIWQWDGSECHPAPTLAFKQKHFKDSENRQKDSTAKEGSNVMGEASVKLRWERMKAVAGQPVPILHLLNKPVDRPVPQNIPEPDVEPPLARGHHAGVRIDILHRELAPEVVREEKRFGGKALAGRGRAEAHGGRGGGGGVEGRGYAGKGPARTAMLPFQQAKTGAGSLVIPARKTVSSRKYGHSAEARCPRRLRRTQSLDLVMVKLRNRGSHP
ncbi:hypothetical protein B0H14DRAFT_2579065 [Mycena olivaceomarginata]|nr:hypothetical protein B0H14DRAFT_2579065 [Mycena olivaceomarginata]